MPHKRHADDVTVLGVRIKNPNVPFTPEARGPARGLVLHAAQVHARRLIAVEDDPVAEVNKALGSVSYMTDMGYRVIFDRDEKTGVDMSRMEHKATGRTTRFRREKNIWVLDAYAKDGEIISEPFVRQP